jgi:signal transduction histidine kinase/DNA-binding response OmpR family regulator
LKSNGWLPSALTRVRTGCLWLVDLCVPPALRQDAQRARSLRTVAGFCYISIPFVALFAGLARRTFGGEFGEFLFVLYLTSLPLLVVGMVLLRVLGRPLLPVCIVNGYFFAMFCTTGYEFGGPIASTLFWLMVPMTTTLFSLGRRSALVFTGLGLVAYAVFLGAHELGYGFPLEGTPQQRARLWFSTSSGLILFVLFSVLTFERARRVAVDTLETANRELERARDLADVASRSKTAFLANMSHEIRTPMTAVLGFTELASDRVAAGALQPEERSALETIQRNGQHLLKIVNDMLDLSKIESGRFEIQPSRFVLVELVSEVATLLRGQAEAKGCRLVVEYVDAVPETIETDPVRLQQVLINLLGNAIKFSFEGQVLLRIQGIRQAELDRVRFQVVDSGIGMTREQLERIFEPFAQAASSTTRLYGGTGLGLSISRTLVERMGGAIDVESTPGVGTTFTVEIPVGTRERVRMLGSAEALDVMARPRPKSAIALQCRVLIVDDNPDNRRLIAYFLRDAGAEVHAVESGAQALETWQALAPDLVLMDIQMPHMDGYATTRALRERGCRAPIVALTAHAMASERERCLVSGFDGYGSKPIDRRRLVDLVDHHVRAGHTPPSCAEPALRPADPPPPRAYAGWDRIAARLLPPEQRQDRAALERARSVLWITLGPVSVLPFEGLMVWSTMAPEVASLAAGLVMLVLPISLGVLAVFRFTGSIALAANTMLAYCFGVISAVTYWSGGPPAPTAFWMVLVPMVALSLVGSGCAFTWAFVAIAHNAALLIAQRAGYVFGPPIPSAWAGVHSTISMAGLLCAVLLAELAYERARNDAVETLAALNRSLAEARAQAERANRAKSSFLASVSHELRTPMTAILGFAELLVGDWRDRPGLDEARSLLATVHASSRRLLGLINDLLDLSKAEAGKLAVERIAFSPASALREVVESLRSSAEVKGLELALALDPRLPATACGDPGHLSQIVRKLVDNAIKFSDRGRIDVCAASADGRLELRVSDTGRGIPVDALPALFDSFHQVDSSATREHGGTGLGLALCQRLVAVLGGTIDVASELGRGTCFSVSVPLADAVPADAVAAPEYERSDRVEGWLLLAEDAPDSQRLIAALLRRAGAEVDVASNGAVALEKIRAASAAGRPYDALLLDMQMPVLDGAATARALRADGHALPILALTAESSAEERERCLAAGCDAYATKPIDRANLLSTLQTLLADKPAPGHE